MKHIARYLSLLLCLVLAFTSSSLVVNAAEVEVDSYHVFLEYFMVSTATTTKLQSMTIYPNNGNVEQYEMARPVSGNVTGMQTRITYATDNGTPLIRGDGEKETLVKLENIPFEYIEFWGEQNPYAGYTHHDVYTILIFYTDGSMEYVKSTNSGSAGLTYNNNGYHTIDFTFTPQADVSKIETIIRADLVVTDSQGTFEGILGEDDGTEYQIYIDQDDGKKGLLASIIEGIKELRDKLVNGFNNLRTAITELPSKIANAIKGLFVPDEEYLDDFASDMDSLLATKFGAVYQVVDITLESWDDINASDEQDTIALPKVSIPLPDNNSFSFGGSEVRIVPEGFEWLASIVKTAVAVVCTLAFVNGLRRRYDDVMGVDE